MIELVWSLSIGHGVAIAPLNPLALEHMPQATKNEINGYNSRNNTSKTESQD